MNTSTRSTRPFFVQLSRFASAFSVALASLLPLQSLAQDGYVYWAEQGSGKIQRALPDGSQVEEVISAAFVYPLSIALETDQGKMTWVDYDAGIIGRANLDGSDTEELVTGLNSPAGLAFDPDEGWMYWKNGSSLQRSNREGTEVEQLLTLEGSFFTGVFDLALDLTGRKVYWALGYKIQRAGLDGTGVEDVVDTGSSYIPMRVTVDASGGKVYWIGNDRTVRRANLDGTGSEDLFTHSSFLSDIVLDVGSGHMVVSTESSFLRANLDGTELQEAFGVTSQPFAVAFEPATGLLYWTTATTIQRARLDGTDLEELILSPVSAPTHLAVDRGAGKMFWSDYYARKIRWANLDGTDIEEVISDTGPSGAVAAAGGTLYWIGRGKLRRADYDGSNASEITDVGSSDGLAVDLDGGKIYWTEWNTGLVRRVNLDGSDLEDIAVGQRSPTGLALDPEAGKVYWADGSDRIIQRADMDGTNVEQLVEGLRGPRGLAIDVPGKKMYWADINGDTIQRANLDGTELENLVTGLGQPYGVALDVIEATSTEQDGPPLDVFTLEQNYPNPFALHTTIGFRQHRFDRVRLEVYDLLGRRISTLVDGYVSPGLHSQVLFAGEMSPGVYVYRLSSLDHYVERKLLVIR